MRRLGGRYIGKGSVRGRLFDLGDFLGAVRTPAASARVAGELYHLPGVAALKSLDRYEGKLYRRDLAEIKLGSGKRARAWVYWLKQAPALQHRIKGGDYAARR